MPAWVGADGQARALERKHAALLSWLWLEGPTPRARLAGLLWPEASEERARGNLRQRLLKLRQEVGELVIDQGGSIALSDHVQVLPASPPEVPLLQSLDFDDCEAFARWLTDRREAEREGRKREWLAKVRDAARDQRLDEALFAADQLLQTDRESEEAYRALMEVYFLRGDHAAALSAWDRCRDMLRQLYGVLPSAATQALGRSILEAAQVDVQTAPASVDPALQHLPAAVLRPHRLVGRESALQSLHQGWQRGDVLVVAGAAGMGKSRLLADWQGNQRAIEASAHGPGGAASSWRAVSVAARPGDEVLPYTSISRLLLASVQHGAAPPDSPHARLAARLLPQWAAYLGLADEPVKTDYERTQALLALARLLLDGQRDGCAALILDDLQFADAASLAALRVLADPLAGGGGRTALRFILSLRADEAGAEARALLDSLAATGRCTRIELAPLSADQVGELLAGLGLAQLDHRAWAPVIWRQMGGNPAFVLESVKLLLSTSAHLHAASDAMPVPPGIEAVIQRRIGLLSPRARHLAQLAALAGNAFSIALAASALACTPLALGEPLRELQQSQVFDGRQFVHDVVAEVTARGVPSAVADFMHRFVAEHLQAHGGAPAEAALHWAACGEWLRAGRAYRQAAQEARARALANEHADLLDRAIDAFERSPDHQVELFEALDERAGADESTGHEARRPQFVDRLQALARSEPQHLAALNHRYGLLSNTGQPVDEAQALAAIDRSRALGLHQTAWEFSRVLGWQYAMNDRADEGLALMRANEPWVTDQAPPRTRAAYRLARANVFAFGDRLAEAIDEGRQALAASAQAGDWPNALPAMSNLGVMHYWRSENEAARQVLEQARERREALYGRGGAGLKIDIHLGAVLYELGRYDEARQMLHGVLQAMADWPDNDYTRLDRLLTQNHLAQMAIALGQADEAAAMLVDDAHGVADRFRGRRLTLRLRWQREFGQVDAAGVTELQTLAATLASPFNNALNRLELARLLPPAQALVQYQALGNSPVALQRPGLQLHAVVLGALAARACGNQAAEGPLADIARALHTRTAAFDLPKDELARRMSELG